MKRKRKPNPLLEPLKALYEAAIIPIHHDVMKAVRKAIEKAEKKSNG